MPDLKPYQFIANRLKTVDETRGAHEDMRKHLKESFPDLYGNVGFECGAGWWLILYDLGRYITWDVEKNGMAMPEVRQIKEKFGSLRFYAQHAEPDTKEGDYNRGKLRGYISVHENLAARTCEVCGQPGEIRNDSGWYKARCEKHNG